MTPEELIIKIAVLEKRMDIAQGQNEILLGFVATKHGKEDLMKYLEFVSGGNGFHAEAQQAAQGMLDHEKTWQHLSHSEPN